MSLWIETWNKNKIFLLFFAFYVICYTTKLEFIPETIMAPYTIRKAFAKDPGSIL